MDLDGLKQINDTFGHQEGNRALVEAAEVIRDSFRHSDILARLGGDEFTALMLDAGKDSIGVVLRRVEQKLDSCNAMLSRRYDLSLSIGIVPGDTDRLSDAEQLLSERQFEDAVTPHITRPRAPVFSFQRTRRRYVFAALRSNRASQAAG